MNELALLSNDELDTAIEQIKERELSFQTATGKKYAVSKMLEYITLLETWGYKFDGNEDSLAVLWAKTLKEEIITMGYDGIREALELWVSEDEYRSFPKIPQLKNACARIGGDPRVEKGRRVQAEAERQMELEHQREMEEFKKNHPEAWARIQAKAEQMQRGQA